MRTVKQVCQIKKTNQQGFVLVLALVMLSVLTLIGVSSMDSANTELKATANAKHHQIAFHATQSLLEYSVSKPATAIINYETRDGTPVAYNDAGSGAQPLNYTQTANSSAVSVSVNYIDCDKGVGMSLEDDKAFGYNLFDVKGTASNLAGSAVSNQTLGVRHPSAAC